MTAIEEMKPMPLNENSFTKPSNLSNNNNSQKEQHIQNQKDRTLFCVNIDQRCTEEILYELFLQVGPIDNLVRKADRNGNLICLITYKHAESCDYAIKLFNGITLFNQCLKVQQSQISTNGPNNRSSSSNLNGTTTIINHYQNNQSSSNANYGSHNRNRQSFDNPSKIIDFQIQQQQQQQQIMNLMISQLSQTSQGLPQNPFFNAMPSLMNNNNNLYNRSKSGPNFHNDNDQSNYNNQYQHQSRRNFDFKRPPSQFDNGNISSYDQRGYSDNRRDSSRNSNNYSSSRTNNNNSDNRHSKSRDDNKHRSRSNSKSPNFKRNRR